MTDERLQIQILQYKPKGLQDRGRHWKILDEYVKLELARLSIPWSEEEEENKKKKGKAQWYMVEHVCFAYA
jgi:hypothetical protein